MAKGIFDDIIIRNSISINELPPYSMTNLRATKTNENNIFWKKMTHSQVTAAYSFLVDLGNLPDKNSFGNIDKENPLALDPMVYRHLSLGTSDS